MKRNLQVDHSPSRVGLMVVLLFISQLFNGSRPAGEIQRHHTKKNFSLGHLFFSLFLVHLLIWGELVPGDVGRWARVCQAGERYHLLSSLFTVVVVVVFKVMVVLFTVVVVVVLRVVGAVILSVLLLIGLPILDKEIDLKVLFEGMGTSIHRSLLSSLCSRDRHRAWSICNL